MQIEVLEIAKIVEDPDQPRKHYDEESLQGLADSIKQHGVLQPITVTPLANVNMFKIITGERRWRAAQKAGLTEMPCIVKELDPEEVLTQQLIENIQREDLQPLEKSRALAHVKDRLGSTNRELAGRLGISERNVGYLLDLLTLPGEIGEKVVSSPNRPAGGQLTEKHARFLKQLNDAPDLQTAVVEKIEKDKLNSDHTGKVVKALKKHPDKVDEILSAPADHLSDFFRDLGPMPFEPDEDEQKLSPRVCPLAQQIVNFLPTLDAVKPGEFTHSDLQQIADSLTSVKSGVEMVLREVRMALGEKV